MINCILLKSRILNRYVVIGMISLTVLGLVSWLFGGEIIPVLFGYGEDVSVSYKEYVYQLWDQLLCWEIFIDSFMRYIVFVFPIIVIIPVLHFVDELRTYFVVGLGRFSKRKSKIIKSMFTHALIGGMAFAIPLVIIFVFMDYFLYPAIYNLDGFTLLFPDGFYFHHSLASYLGLVLIYYFPLAFSIALQGSAIALYTRDKIMVILNLEIIYIMENMLAVWDRRFKFVASLNVLTSYNTSDDLITIFLPIISNFIIAMGLVLVSLHKDGRRIVKDE